jgi:hypothetical protein
MHLYRVKNGIRRDAEEKKIYRKNDKKKERVKEKRNEMRH